MSITAIMTGYERPDNLHAQLEAIKNQSLPPSRIQLWYNQGSVNKAEFSKDDGIEVVSCNTNFKYHGRFALGLLAQTQMVAVFDDDTIPGSDWFHNCMNSMATHDGIMGASGVILKGPSYFPYTNAGWNGTPQNHRTVEVDLVGHAWFMQKDHLRYMWYEEPISWASGEDIHLSFMAQKHGDIKTYVPPHRPLDKNSWGSLDGQRLGTDDKAESCKNPGQFVNLRNDLVTKAINRGWEPLYKRQS